MSRCRYVLAVVPAADERQDLRLQGEQLRAAPLRAQPREAVHEGPDLREEVRRLRRDLRPLRGQRVGVVEAPLLQRAHRAQERRGPHVARLPRGARRGLERVNLRVDLGDVSDLHQLEREAQAGAEELRAVVEARGEGHRLARHREPLGRSDRLGERGAGAVEHLEERLVVAEGAGGVHGLHGHEAHRLGIRRGLEARGEARGQPGPQPLLPRRQHAQPLLEQRAHRRVRLPCRQLGAVGQRGAGQQQPVSLRARPVCDAHAQRPAARQVPARHPRAREQQRELRGAALVRRPAPQLVERALQEGDRVLEGVRVDQRPRGALRSLREPLESGPPRWRGARSR